jgi:hypothetical protein
LLKHVESKETDADFKPGKIRVSNDQILDSWLALEPQA